MLGDPKDTMLSRALKSPQYCRGDIGVQTNHASNREKRRVREIREKCHRIQKGMLLPWESHADLS